MMLIENPLPSSAFHTFSVGLAAGRAGGPMSAAVSAREHRSRSHVLRGCGGRARSCVSNLSGKGSLSLITAGWDEAHRAADMASRAGGQAVR